MNYAKQFISMLPYEFVKNMRLSLTWKGPSDLNDFLPSLKRGGTFYLLRKVTLFKTPLILNKTTKILTFLMSADELILDQCKISMSQGTNETNYDRTLRKLKMLRCEEAVNFMQGLGEADEVVIRESVLKLAQNRQFVPVEHASKIKIEDCKYRFQI